jgi:hypothetical protein
MKDSGSKFLEGCRLTVVGTVIAPGLPPPEDNTPPYDFVVLIRNLLSYQWNILYVGN